MSIRGTVDSENTKICIIKERKKERKEERKNERHERRKRHKRHEKQKRSTVEFLLLMKMPVCRCVCMSDSEQKRGRQYNVSIVNGPSHLFYSGTFAETGGHRVRNQRNPRIPFHPQQNTASIPLLPSHKPMSTSRTGATRRPRRYPLSHRGSAAERNVLVSLSGLMAAVRVVLTVQTPAKCRPTCSPPDRNQAPIPAGLCPLNGTLQSPLVPQCQIQHGGYHRDGSSCCVIDALNRISSP